VVGSQRFSHILVPKKVIENQVQKGTIHIQQNSVKIGECGHVG
jgi:hypothetical protein